jgi:hypothetical protein
MAIRVVHQTPYNAHTKSLFKKLKILPLSLLVDYFKIQFMLQFSHKVLPFLSQQRGTPMQVEELVRILLLSEMMMTFKFILLVYPAQNDTH